MKMKLNIVDSSYSYSIYLVSGLLAWSSFSTILIRLSTSITDRAHLIKKINIPTFIYQIGIFITEFVLLLLSYFLAVCFLFAIEYPVGLAIFAMIPILFIQTVFAFGLGVVVSLFVPFFKDIREAFPIVIQLWFWLTPIVYLASSIIDKYPILFSINPMFYFVEIYQNIFLYGETPSSFSILGLTIMAILQLIVAVYMYKKMISSVKDIL